VALTTTKAPNATARAGIRSDRGPVDTSMNGALLLLVVLAIPYLAHNLWRLSRGRSWAITPCTLAKEWEQREHAKRVAARAAQRT
jgi:hypothetical protein